MKSALFVPLLALGLSACGDIPQEQVGKADTAPASATRVACDITQPGCAQLVDNDIETRSGLHTRSSIGRAFMGGVAAAFF